MSDDQEMPGPSSNVANIDSNSELVNYQFTSSDTIEDHLNSMILKTRYAANFVLKIPLVLKVSGVYANVLFDKKDKYITVNYYLTNGVNVYLFQVFKENDSYLNANTSKEYLLMDDVNQLLLLGNILQLKQLKFVQYDKDEIDNSEPSLYEKGYFCLAPKTKANLITSEQTEDYPADCNYPPFWRYLDNVEQNDLKDLYDVAMHILILEEAIIQSKAEVAFSTLKALSSNDSTINWGYGKVLVGDCRANQAYLHFSYNLDEKYDCEQVENLKPNSAFVIFCTKFISDFQNKRVSLSIASLDFVYEETKLSMKRLDKYEWVDLIKTKLPTEIYTKSLEIKEQSPRFDPCLLLLKLALPTVSKPQAFTYGKWNNLIACKCKKYESWMTYLFERVSVPMFENPTPTNYGVTHEAVIVHFCCLNCSRINELILTVEKGGAGIQGHIGHYKNYERLGYYYKHLTFDQLKNAINHCDNNYHLFFSNCKHFANTLFEFPLAKKARMLTNESSNSDEIDQKNEDFEKHEGYLVTDIDEYYQSMSEDGDDNPVPFLGIESRCLRCKQIVSHNVPKIFTVDQKISSKYGDKYITFNFINSPKDKFNAVFDENSSELVDKKDQLNLADMECVEHKPIRNTMTFYCTEEHSDLEGNHLIWAKRELVQAFTNLDVSDDMNNSGNVEAEFESDENMEEEDETLGQIEDQNIK